MGGTKFVYVFGIVSFWFIIFKFPARTLNNSVSYAPVYYGHDGNFNNPCG